MKQHKFTRARLAALDRPAGYLSDCEAAALDPRADPLVFDAGSLAYASLRAKYAGYPREAARKPVVPPQSVAAREWPFWAKMLRARAQPGDRGLGDVLHRDLGEPGEAWEAVTKEAGKSCGCLDRRAWMNQRYPLP